MAYCNETQVYVDSIAPLYGAWYLISRKPAGSRKHSLKMKVDVSY